MHAGKTLTNKNKINLKKCLSIRYTANNTYNHNFSWHTDSKIALNSCGITSVSHQTVTIWRQILQFQLLNSALSYKLPNCYSRRIYFFKNSFYLVIILIRCINAKELARINEWSKDDGEVFLFFAVTLHCTKDMYKLIVCSQ